VKDLTKRQKNLEGKLFTIEECTNDQSSFEKRLAAMVISEAAQPIRWFYCSFFDTEKFRGGVFVQARGLLDCTIRTKELNANPGGELLAIPIPAEEEHNMPPESFRNRLLTKEELESFGPIVRMDVVTVEESAYEERGYEPD